MRKVLGAALLLSVLVAVFAASVADLGLLKALAVWATVLGLVGAISLGVWLLLVD